MNFNVRVEYEPLPIRHIAVQCPNCKKWFRGWEITEDDLREAEDKIQKLTDRYVDEIDKLCEAKEKEVMSV